MFNREISRNNYYFQSIEDAAAWKICEKHLNIDENDVAEIVRYGKMLPLLTELEGCDTFIDCFTDDPDIAIVVAQCSPPNTFYEHSFIGELIGREGEPAVFRTFELEAPSKEVKAVIRMKGGRSEVLIRQNVTLLKNASGEKIGVLIMEKPLIHSNPGRSNANGNPENLGGPEKYDIRNILNPYALTKLVHDAIICFNKSGVAIFANDRAKKMYKDLEYKKDIIGMPFEDMAFGNIGIDDVTDRGYIEQNNIQISKYFLKVIYSKICEGEEYIGAAIIIRDITEKRLAEKELILKSAAIDEMHHRVKNHLQTIISLVRLQVKRLNDPRITMVCEEIISRIYSISLTHEILSQRGVDVVDLKEMLTILAGHTKRYISQDSAQGSLNIAISVEGVSTQVGSDIGCAVAMIVNELLQNSIKHAFGNMSQGLIQINVLQKDKTCSIIFSDNGVGFDPGCIDNAHLGMKLVHSLVSDKLFGKLDIASSTSGTKIEFSFDLQKPNI